jgi:hypothetical protein
MTEDQIKRRLAVALVALDDLQSAIERDNTWFDLERAEGLRFLADRAVVDAFFGDLGGTDEDVAAAREELARGMPHLFVRK